MTRIRQGWALTKKSWAVLREHRELFVFPLVGGIAVILMTIIVLAPGLYLFEEGRQAVGIPVVIVGLYLLAFVSFFMAVALAGAADRIFRGEPTTVADGFAVARSRIPQIAGWAALSATVGLVLNALQSRGGPLGAIAAGLLDMAWNLVTFLAAPVVAVEGTGAFATLKRSGGIFNEKWGQQITGNAAVGGIVFLLGFIPAAILIAAGIGIWTSSGFGGAILVVVGVIVFAIAAVLGQALHGVFGMALYRYATGGETVAGFTDADLESAVKPKKGFGKTPAPA